MRSLRRLLKRLGSWATATQDEDRLRAELQEHLDLATADNIRAGLSSTEARRLALLKFGAVEAIRESYRDQRGLPGIETAIQDARHALRHLRMAPAFTIAIVTTLALGIGATTSIFTLANAVLLKSLPVAKPGELWRLGKQSWCCYLAGYSQEKEFGMVSYQLYQYLRDHTHGFSELAAFPAGLPLFGVRRAGTSESAQSLPGEFVSGNYFAMFGIPAYIGRALTPADDRPGAPPVAVMSYRLWQERYGSDSSVLGSIFNFDDKPFTVVGISPPGFFGDALRDTPPDFYLPLNMEPYVQPDADLRKYDTHWLALIGRIPPGIAPASVEAEMRVALKQWLESHWSEMSANDRARFPEQTLYLTPGGAGITRMREQYERWLKLLLIASGVVLLIVCANVANLMLVRGIERRQQNSLSMALGARASRIVRQALTESMLLAFAGGAVGLAIAFPGTSLILHLAFPSSPGFPSVPIDAAPSTPVLLFALATSLATGIAFGIAPAWMATRADPIDALRGAGRSTARTGSFARKTLVVVQVALSLALLSAAGLLTKALLRSEHQDFGFAQDRRIVLRTNPRLAGYRADQLSRIYRRIHEAIAGIPGVSAVALCMYSPQSNGQWGSGVWVAGHAPPGPRDMNIASWDRVTNGYLEVFGTRLLRGRDLGEQDTAASRKVAVINAAFARRFFPNEDPIGKHFGPNPKVSALFEIVGVVQDARYLTYKMDQPIDPFYFVPEAQADYTQRNAGSLYLSDAVIVAKPGASVSDAQLRTAIASVDSNLPIVWIRSMKEQVASQFIQQRLIARITSFFGILSLVLASIGLYGVTAYTAGRRTGEIGVRVALGATRGNVIALVVRGAIALVILGLLLGLPLSFFAGRLVAHQLYGLDPYNPQTIAIAVLALALPALAASFVPALRASLIAPAEALKHE